MSYDDKYPDMSAMYNIMFETEDKLKNKIKELETELIRTRKALDVAVDALKGIKALDDNGNYDIEDYDCQVARITTQALEQITELEQKD